jgi:hypothetical protein
MKHTDINIKRQIRNKTLQWQSLAAGKWSPAIDRQMEQLDKEIDKLYELLEDKQWQWYQPIEEC